MNGDWYSANELARVIAAAIYDCQFGVLTVTGTLADWTRHRTGAATAQLVDGDTHLRLYADRHTARTINDTLADTGCDLHQPTAVITRGQLTMHPRWGLRLQLIAIALDQPADPDSHVNIPVVDETNKTRPWPPRIQVIGLIDPAHGDAGRADLLDVLADRDLTIMVCV